MVSLVSLGSDVSSEVEGVGTSFPDFLVGVEVLRGIPVRDFLFLSTVYEAALELSLDVVSLLLRPFSDASLSGFTKSAATVGPASIIIKHENPSVLH